MTRTFKASASTGRLQGPNIDVPCVFGTGGLVDAQKKTEGDKASPIGLWPARRAFYRADRMDQPKTMLVLDAISKDDGWCDAPLDPAYNLPVRKPYPVSHETLMREDGLYDLVVVLGHNDDPPQPGLGSAIFLHCRAEDGRGTAGCLAIDRDDLVKLVEQLRPGDLIAFEP
ncbi:L,D-transpeptidase family protein [Maricaulaceae bacterium EIL42A08]|nr:L,D-transpeptidase family protein [Maricaulaceae bacterium EIL42A08]